MAGFATDGAGHVADGARIASSAENRGGHVAQVAEVSRRTVGALVQAPFSGVRARGARLRLRRIHFALRTRWA